MDWLEDNWPLIVIIALLLAFVTFAVSFSWWSAGRQSQIYKEITGKTVSQSEMFHASKMFKIMPEDIKRGE
jgi:hypothetical protein